MAGGGTRLHPSSVLCDVSSILDPRLIPGPGPPHCGCGLASLATTCHPPVCSAATLPGAGAAGGEETAQLETITTTRGFARDGAEGTLNLTTIRPPLLPAMIKSLLPGRQFCKSKNEVQKTTCSFQSKTVAIYFPFEGKKSTQCFRFHRFVRLLLPCQSFIVPRRRDAIENTKYILYKLLINIGCICRIAL